MHLNPSASLQHPCHPPGQDHQQPEHHSASSPASRWSPFPPSLPHIQDPTFQVHNTLKLPFIPISNHLLIRVYIVPVPILLLGEGLHTNNKQFLDMSGVSENPAHFWPYLLGNSNRLHRLRAHPCKTAPHLPCFRLQSQAPGNHLCSWPTGCISEVLRSSGSTNF